MREFESLPQYQSGSSIKVNYIGLPCRGSGFNSPLPHQPLNFKEVLEVAEDKRLLLAQWAESAAMTRKYYKLFMSSLIVSQILFILMLIIL